MRFFETGITFPPVYGPYQASGTATGFGAGTIDYLVTGGGAGSSFNGGAGGNGAGILVFDAGDTSEQVIVSPTDDTTGEGEETVIFTIGTGTGYTPAAPTSATGTILEDDTNVTVTVSPASASETTGTLVYTFTVNALQAANLVVDFTVGGLNPALFGAGNDYTVSGADSFSATSGSITRSYAASIRPSWRVTKRKKRLRPLFGSADP